MSELPLTPPELNPSFRDRKTGLVVFGVIAIVLGGVAGLSTLATLAVGAMQPQAVGTPRYLSMAVSFVWMGALALGVVWLGIGSVMARRWARALILCGSWVALFAGCASTVFVIWMLPAATGHPGMDPQAMAVVRVVTIVFVVGFEIVVPALFIWFYRQPDVKRTCEARNPAVSWTDRCPLPVLTFALLQAFGGVMLLLWLPMGTPFVFAGHLLEGAGRTLAGLAFAGISLYAAIGFYRLQMRAWTIYAAAIGLWCCSNLFLPAHYTWQEMARAGGVTESQISSVPHVYLLMSPSGQRAIMAACLVVVGVYLLVIRKYFKREQPSNPPN